MCIVAGVTNFSLSGVSVWLGDAPVLESKKRETVSSHDAWGKPTLQHYWHSQSVVQVGPRMSNSHTLTRGRIVAGNSRRSLHGSCT